MLTRLSRKFRGITKLRNRKVVMAFLDSFSNNAVSSNYGLNASQVHRIILAEVHSLRKLRDEAGKSAGNGFRALRQDRARLRSLFRMAWKHIDKKQNYSARERKIIKRNRKIILAVLNSGSYDTVAQRLHLSAWTVKDIVSRELHSISLYRTDIAGSISARLKSVRRHKSKLKTIFKAAWASMDKQKLAA